MTKNFDRKSQRSVAEPLDQNLTAFATKMVSKVSANPRSFRKE